MKFGERLKIFLISYTIVLFVLLGLTATDGLGTQQRSLDTYILPFLHLTSGSVNFVSSPFVLVIVALAALSPGVFFLKLKVSTAFKLTVAAILLSTGTVLGLLWYYHLSFPLLYLILAFGLGTAVAIVVKMIFASAEQEFLRLAFSQFVSEDMLKELLKNPDKLSLQGKEMPITVMFLDIRGFTSFSERISPQLVVTRLNELLDIVSQIIVKHKGHVNKYIGDSVMAFWGAPNPDKKQATNACKAALEIKQKIEVATEFQVGIGINFGKAIVGNIGSKKRFDYTVIGDTVNTASRLETVTKEFNQPIIVSASVVEKLQEESTKVKLEDLGTTYLKGKLEEIHVYALSA